MKIRRILATAVAAAVTTPVVLLSAAPAFADTKPTAADQRTAKPTIEELRLAVTKAQAAYDAAVIADSDAQKAFEALLKDDNPLMVKRAEAKAAATAAAGEAAKAKKAVEEAQAKVDAAAEADKPALQLELDKAKEAQKLADKAAADAQTAYEKAVKAVDDERIAASRKIAQAQKDKAAALKTLDEAKAALRAALEEEPGEDECLDDKNLAVTITGPKKVTAGTSAVFNFRITNKNKAGGLTFGEVGGSADAYSVENGKSDGLRLAWSSANSPKWETIGEDTLFSSLAAVKPGGSFDFKLKLTVDAKAKAGDAAVGGTGGYENEDGSCGMSEDGAYAEFAIVKPAKPAKPTPSPTQGSGNGNTTQQGGSSTTPVNNGTTGGTLAATGAGSSTMPIALAGGAAVVLGAGAMVVVRRRKAGADA
ncbi:LPXTG cell wall anchor domain-containing protein [Streptomyces sp. NPDC058740]|uniref:LPXTG cell wall anchor domain-containing protein n=1 Tax=Streptomyces sp. NPDC058740 TaxID=3346619 RepID=UPI0036B61ECA